MMLPYALLGMLFTLALDVYRSGVTWTEFSWAKWANDNLMLVFIGVIVVTVSVLVPELNGMDYMNEYGAFLTGAGFQGLLANHADRRRTKKGR